MRNSTLGAVRFHANTIHANSYRITAPKNKIAGGGEVTDNNIYLTTKDGAYLIDQQNNYLICN